MLHAKLDKLHWCIPAFIAVALAIGLDRGDAPTKSREPKVNLPAYLGPNTRMPTGETDCNLTSNVDDPQWIDLTPLGIHRRPSGLCAADPFLRHNDRSFAAYRVWLDQLIDERQRAIALGADMQAAEIGLIDDAIRYAARELLEAGESLGPMPFVVREKDLPPSSPTVTLDDVLRSSNTTPHQKIP